MNESTLYDAVKWAVARIDELRKLRDLPASALNDRRAARKAELEAWIQWLIALSSRTDSEAL
jgi:hypothetical protein